MPIILRCNGCGKETEDNRSKGFSGINWLQKGVLGGTLVLCPKCRIDEDEEDAIIEERRILIDAEIEIAKREAEKKYTLEYVREKRKKEFGNLLALRKKMAVEDLSD